MIKKLKKFLFKKSFRVKKENTQEDNVLVKFGYILLVIFCILSVLLLGGGYLLYLNGINPFK